MKVGILGSGDVARSLATGFIRHGHEVMIGTRDAAKLKDWSSKNPAARIGNFFETAEAAEIIVLAVKGSVAEKALSAAGAVNLKGKVIIDAANPIADAAPENGVLKFFTNLDESLMERLQKTFPEARFVKAFNSVGHALMVNPKLKGGKPTMFICGNDDEAKNTVKGVLDQFGWETEDLGKVEAARALEPLCILWCIPGFLSNDWAHAFKLLR